MRLITLLTKLSFVMTGLFAANLLHASTITFDIVVDAKANLYSAGHAYLGGDGTGVFPPYIAFDGNPGKVMTINEISGTIGCNWSLTNGADGTCMNGIDTNVRSSNGISGIYAQATNMFLTGLFTTDLEPMGEAPARLRYQAGSGLTTSDRSYNPLLHQTFFIGDGLTATESGLNQLFYVPAGATRLYLGFADSFDTYPSNYTDNVGSLAVQLSLSDTTSAPEPGTAFSFGVASLLLSGALILRLIRQA